MGFRFRLVGRGLVKTLLPASDVFRGRLCAAVITKSDPCSHSVTFIPLRGFAPLEHLSKALHLIVVPTFHDCILRS